MVIFLLLLCFYCIAFFSSLILFLSVMISFCIVSKAFFLKPQGLTDARVASITKKEQVLQYVLYKDSYRL